MAPNEHTIIITRAGSIREADFHRIITRLNGKTGVCLKWHWSLCSAR